MKIRELLEATLPKPGASKLPTAPSAPSIDDEPEAIEPDGSHSPEEDADENAVADFKQDAMSVGGGIYALSAWSYPAAWSGGGYSDILMHRITTLASDLDVDLGDYEHLNDQDMADGRRLEIVFFNEQTDALFRLSASGNDGRVEFSPSLADLQSSGAVTNAQLPKLKKIEAMVVAWTQVVPEDWMDEPRDRRWQSAERKLTGYFDFAAPDVDDGDGDPSMSDPDHPNFWQGIDTRDPGDEEAGKAGMARLIAKAKAEKAARLTQGN